MANAEIIYLQQNNNLQVIMGILVLLFLTGGDLKILHFQFKKKKGHEIFKKNVSDSIWKV